jgi:membrane-bound serine protease (ClpP class)
MVFAAPGAASVQRDSALAGRAASTQKPGIAVVQVEGLLDPPNAALVRDAITDANRRHLTMLMLQINSKGAIDNVGSIVRAINRSRVPVVAWVGPNGAEARGGAALIVEAAHVAFVSQGSSVGPAQPVRLDQPGDSSPSSVAARLRALASDRGRSEDGAARIARRSLSPHEAADAHATNGVRPTVGEVIVTLDGKTVHTAAGSVHLSTATVVGKGRDRRRHPNQEVVFEGLGLGAQAQHKLISPSIAYFLLVAGLALIVFEFFAASVGFAAFVGAVSVVGAMYGFSHLPVHWWAVALLVLAAFGFAIDAQAGGLAFWTGIGWLTLVLGSLSLYGGTSLRPAWWVLAVVVLGAGVFYLFAVPAFLRARFSTPTVGREAMIGETGTAEVAVDPDGVVVVRGARWRARTNRATPIAAGDTVRIAAVEGVVLEVEPMTGAARDHREGRGKAKGKAGETAADADGD